jgi:hypothetical protein
LSVAAFRGAESEKEVSGTGNFGFSAEVGGAYGQEGGKKKGDEESGSQGGQKDHVQESHVEEEVNEEEGNKEEDHGRQIQDRESEKREDHQARYVDYWRISQQNRVREAACGLPDL